MFTVALIGPDGAGKTTISRRILQSLQLPIKYVYMGVNPDSSNLLLPTTWLARSIKKALGTSRDSGPPDPNRKKQRPKGALKRAVSHVRAGLRLLNRLSEEWFRQSIVWYYTRTGRIVLLDRHFFIDYYAHDIAPDNEELPLARRIHGFVLEHLFPRPDLVICLDAPPDVLLARKGEGSVELLESRRQEYLQIRPLVERFVIVDATQTIEAVERDVSQLIRDQYERAKQRKQVRTANG